MTARKDNIIPFDDIDFDDIKFDEDVEEQKEKPKPKKDFYNHRADKLLEKYKDLSLEESGSGLESLKDLKENRRALSEKLETDPEFRKKYIDLEQKKLVEKILNDDSDIMKQVESVDDIKGDPTVLEEVIPENDDGSFVGDSPYRPRSQERKRNPGFAREPGVLINNVENLTINIYL